MSEGIAEQTRELTEEARASGHKIPLRHAWGSPPPGAAWGEKEWDAYWTLYERVQGLQGCAYSEAVHDKPGADGRPPHRHRVYLALTERGTLVRTGWDYARQEAVSRVMEHDTGQAFVKGAHNVRAARVVAQLGREDVAAAMAAAGLLDGSRARAALTPDQRAQQERTGITKADVARDVAAAWKASDGSQAFMAALQERGLRLAQGTKKDGVPVIVDASGATHGLRQMLGMAAREVGKPALRKAAIAAFLGEVILPSLDQARAAQHTAGAAPAEPAMDPVVPSAVPDHDRVAHVQEHDTIVPSVTEQPSAGDVSPPVLLPVQSQKGMDPVPSTTSSIPHDDEPGPGGGGGAALAVEEVDGPGEPPGPGASVREIQEYRARLLAYEDRKGKALLRQQAALAAENDRNQQKGARHGYAGTGIISGPLGAPAVLSALGPAHGIRPVLPNEAGDDWHGHAHPGGDQGGPGHGAARREHPGGDADARESGGRSPGRRKGTAGSDMLEAGLDGRQAFCHRASLARAASALRSIDVAAMLDLLEPSRAAMRILDAEDERIAALRAQEPYPCPLDRDPDGCARAARAVLWQPLHEARKALPAAMERARVAAQSRRWWNPATWDEAREAGAALALAHAAVAAATPSADSLEEAEHGARVQAVAARDAGAAWQEGTGNVLDRRAALLAGIRAAMDGGDTGMRRILLQEGVPAAMRAVTGQEATQAHPGEGHIHATDGVVVAFRTPA